MNDSMKKKKTAINHIFTFDDFIHHETSFHRSKNVAVSDMIDISIYNDFVRVHLNILRYTFKVHKDVSFMNDLMKKHLQ